MLRTVNLEIQIVTRTRDGKHVRVGKFIVDGTRHAAEIHDDIPVHARGALPDNRGSRVCHVMRNIDGVEEAHRIDGKNGGARGAAAGRRYHIAAIQRRVAFDLVGTACGHHCCIEDRFEKSQGLFAFAFAFAFALTFAFTFCSGAILPRIVQVLTQIGESVVVHVAAAAQFREHRVCGRGEVRIVKAILAVSAQQGIHELHETGRQTERPASHHADGRVGAFRRGQRDRCKSTVAQG